jgi:hypothetical protein
LFDLPAGIYRRKESKAKSERAQFFARRSPAAASMCRPDSFAALRRSGLKLAPLSNATKPDPRAYQLGVDMLDLPKEAPAGVSESLTDLARFVG